MKSREKSNSWFFNLSKQLLLSEPTKQQKDHSSRESDFEKDHTEPQQPGPLNQQKESDVPYATFPFEAQIMHPQYTYNPDYQPSHNMPPQDQQYQYPSQWYYQNQPQQTYSMPPHSHQIQQPQVQPQLRHWPQDPQTQPQQEPLRNGVLQHQQQQQKRQKKRQKEQQQQLPHQHQQQLQHQHQQSHQQQLHHQQQQSHQQQLHHQQQQSHQQQLHHQQQQSHQQQLHHQQQLQRQQQQQQQWQSAPQRQPVPPWPAYAQQGHHLHEQPNNPPNEQHWHIQLPGQQQQNQLNEQQRQNQQLQKQYRQIQQDKPLLEPDSGLDPAVERYRNMGGFSRPQINNESSAPPGGPIHHHTWVNQHSDYAAFHPGARNEQANVFSTPPNLIAVNGTPGVVAAESQSAVRVPFVPTLAPQQITTQSPFPRDIAKSVMAGTEFPEHFVGSNFQLQKDPYAIMNNMNAPGPSSGTTNYQHYPHYMFEHSVSEAVDPVGRADNVCGSARRTTVANNAEAMGSSCSMQDNSIHELPYNIPLGQHTHFEQTHSNPEGTSNPLPGTSEEQAAENPASDLDNLDLDQLLAGSELIARRNAQSMSQQQPLDRSQGSYHGIVEATDQPQQVNTWSCPNWNVTTGYTQPMPINSNWGPGLNESGMAPSTLPLSEGTPGNEVNIEMEENENTDLVTEEITTPAIKLKEVIVVRVEENPDELEKNIQHKSPPTEHVEVESIPVDNEEIKNLLDECGNIEDKHLPINKSAVNNDPSPYLKEEPTESPAPNYSDLSNLSEHQSALNSPRIPLTEQVEHEDTLVEGEIKECLTEIVARIVSESCPTLLHPFHHSDGAADTEKAVDATETSQQPAHSSNVERKEVEYYSTSVGSLEPEEVVDDEGPGELDEEEDNAVERRLSLEQSPNPFFWGNVDEENQRSFSQDGHHEQQTAVRQGYQEQNIQDLEKSNSYRQSGAGGYNDNWRVDQSPRRRQSSENNSGRSNEQRGCHHHNVGNNASPNRSGRSDDIMPEPETNISPGTHTVLPISEDSLVLPNNDVSTRNFCEGRFPKKRRCSSSPMRRDEKKKFETAPFSKTELNFSSQDAISSPNSTRDDSDDIQRSNANTGSKVGDEKQWSNTQKPTGQPHNQSEHLNHHDIPLENISSEEDNVSLHNESPPNSPEDEEEIKKEKLPVRGTTSGDVNDGGKILCAELLESQTNFENSADSLEKIDQIEKLINPTLNNDSMEIDNDETQDNFFLLDSVSENRKQETLLTKGNNMQLVKYIPPRDFFLPPVNEAVVRPTDSTPTLEMRNQLSNDISSIRVNSGLLLQHYHYLDLVKTAQSLFNTHVVTTLEFASSFLSEHQGKEFMNSTQPGSHSVARRMEQRFGMKIPCRMTTDRTATLQCIEWPEQGGKFAEVSEVVDAIESDKTNGTIADVTTTANMICPADEPEITMVTPVTEEYGFEAIKQVEVSDLTTAEGAADDIKHEKLARVVATNDTAIADKMITAERIEDASVPNAAGIEGMINAEKVTVAIPKTVDDVVKVAETAKSTGILEDFEDAEAEELPEKVEAAKLPEAISDDNTAATVVETSVPFVSREHDTDAIVIAPSISRNSEDNKTAEMVNAAEVTKNDALATTAEPATTTPSDKVATEPVEPAKPVEVDYTDQVDEIFKYVETATGENEVINVADVSKIVDLVEPVEAAKSTGILKDSEEAEAEELAEKVEAAKLPEAISDDNTAATVVETSVQVVSGERDTDDIVIAPSISRNSEDNKTAEMVNAAEVTKNDALATTAEPATTTPSDKVATESVEPAKPVEVDYSDQVDGIFKTVETASDKNEVINVADVSKIVDLVEPVEAVHVERVVNAAVGAGTAEPAKLDVVDAATIVTAPKLDDAVNILNSVSFAEMIGAPDFVEAAEHVNSAKDVEAARDTDATKDSEDVKPAKTTKGSTKAKKKKKAFRLTIPRRVISKTVLAQRRAEKKAEKALKAMRQAGSGGEDVVGETSRAVGEDAESVKVAEAVKIANETDGPPAKRSRKSTSTVQIATVRKPTIGRNREPRKPFDPSQPRVPRRPRQPRGGKRPADAELDANRSAGQSGDNTSAPVPPLPKKRRIGRPRKSSIVVSDCTVPPTVVSDGTVPLIDVSDSSILNESHDLTVTQLDPTVHDETSTVTPKVAIKIREPKAVTQPVVKKAVRRRGPAKRKTPALPAQTSTEVGESSIGPVEPIKIKRPNPRDPIPVLEPREKTARVRKPVKIDQIEHEWSEDDINDRPFPMIDKQRKRKFKKRGIQPRTNVHSVRGVAAAAEVMPEETIMSLEPNTDVQEEMETVSEKKEVISKSNEKTLDEKDGIPVQRGEYSDEEPLDDYNNGLEEESEF